jgi:hypothetical protein
MATVTRFGATGGTPLATTGIYALGASWLGATTGPGAFRIRAGSATGATLVHVDTAAGAGGSWRFGGAGVYVEGSAHVTALGLVGVSVAYQ